MFCFFLLLTSVIMKEGHGIRQQLGLDQKKPKRSPATASDLTRKLVAEYASGMTASHVGELAAAAASSSSSSSSYALAPCGRAVRAPFSRRGMGRLGRMGVVQKWLVLTLVVQTLVVQTLVVLTLVARVSGAGRLQSLRCTALA